jgi:hypothetical protein
MKLLHIVRELALENLTPELSEQLEMEVEHGYASDLLSDVLANAESGAVLVTIQAHLNTIAVALHARIAAVVLAGEHRPDPAVVARAVDERIPLLVTKLPTFEVVGRLYALGLRGEGA